MYKLGPNYLSLDGKHFFTSTSSDEVISKPMLDELQSWLPATVDSHEEALTYNQRCEEFPDYMKRSFKISMQQISSIKAEIAFAKNNNQPQIALAPSPLNIGALVGAVFGKRSKPDESAVEDNDINKALTARLEAAEDRSRLFRERCPMVQPFWYARSEDKQLELNHDLPENVMNLLKQVLHIKRYMPQNKRGRVTDWYFGISHAGLYVAISNWLDFRVFESLEELNKAQAFWRGATEIQYSHVQHMHNPNYQTRTDYLLTVLSGESKSQKLFSLYDTASSKRRLNFYGSAHGFIWSERTEGTYQSFSRSRYQICREPSHFFATLSRYISSKKKYEFCTPDDFELYTDLCPRINRV